MSPLELAETNGGTRLRLRVRPRSRRAALLGVHSGALRIAVTAPPERGKANIAVLELLAEILGLAPSDLELTAGHGSRDKSVRIPLPADAVRAKMRAVLKL